MPARATIREPAVATGRQITRESLTRAYPRTALYAGMPHDTLLLALPVPLLDQRPLVVGLAAAREAELDLGPAGRGEVELKRDQRHPVAADGAREPVDLALAQQQLAGPTGLVVEAVAAVELGN